MRLCEQLGVPLAPDKTVGPTTPLQFLGITLDTVSMKARLPDDKLAQSRSLIHSFLNREKAILREMQSIVGVFLIFQKKLPTDDAIWSCLLGIDKDDFRVVPKTTRFVFALFT